jgi:hypothetical protein
MQCNEIQYKVYNDGKEWIDHNGQDTILKMHMYIMQIIEYVGLK